ncbi:helix-turn-helix transcriptional regulator [Pyramidobacter sp.]|uniref:helix-turn-helix transcriptional regulator n=1 Tax=Pyramidobacter sp. TaxID=1943581 RepID=UPI0025D2C915|nr:WYL domain-containing protein [Pyramidobacter sp.]MCI7402609.1 WYL domain-containing protein [Pyramidobacter sp.]MDY3213234.1 WYL domain-containing protein [Pyramidobacter sp.]
MEQSGSRNKIQRVLSLYQRLMGGSTVNKNDEAKRFCVNARSIQRDIDDLRAYLSNAAAEGEILNDVVYDRRSKGYRLRRSENIKLSNSEILAVCKILLDSRAFARREMLAVLQKLIDSSVPKEERKRIEDLIRNEALHYVELRHRRAFIDKLWAIGEAIRDRHYIEIEYRLPKDKTFVTRKLRPVAVMFSEYYFYVAVFIDDEEIRRDLGGPRENFPVIYRVDRIINLKVLGETFGVPYRDRFEENKLRKRIQFMSGGRLQRVIFTCRTSGAEAALDRLPTAKVLKQKDGVYTIAAEAFGSGIDFWLRSQGDAVAVIRRETLS